MELLQLRYFYESAVNESFSRTAKNHMVPLTTVSASIKRLEKELDCRLFVRSSNRVHLSEAGKRFFESVRDMFADLDKGVAGLKNKQEEKPVRILVTDDRWVITELIVRYRELNPTATFFLNMTRRNADPDDYDIIIEKKCDRYPDRQVFPLGEYKLRFCCSTRNPICSRRLTVQDLAQEGFLGFEEDGNLFRCLLSICEEAGFTPKITAMCNDVNCYLRLLVGNMGLVLMKEWKHPPEGTRYLDMVDFDRSIQLMAYYRPESENKQVNAFVEFLKKEAPGAPDLYKNMDGVLVSKV